MTTPTPTANPYAPTVVVPEVHNSTGSAAMPATVSNVTGKSVIAASQNRSAAHNALVLAGSGRKVVGGAKRKRSSNKHSKRKQNNKQSKRKQSNKQSKRKQSRRRRGWNPTPTPKPSAMPVPQFSGAHNAGASLNSQKSNDVLVKAAARAEYDNPNAPASNTRV